MSTATLFALPVEEAAVAFFYEHAGYAYGPLPQTREEGRQASARDLAEAEAYAVAHGWEAQWSEDPDGEYGDRDTEWAHWPHYYCQVGPVSKESGSMSVLAALGSVMFKDRGDESSDPYGRVVEAELFAEAMREHLDAIERGEI